MVRASEKEHFIQKSKSFSAKKIFDITKLIDNDETEDDKMVTRSQGSIDIIKSPLSKDGTANGLQAKDRSSDVEMMKERFAKLLLGEDMSGGGKGVSSALALSNAITNLAASVFGEHRRLEPMSVENKARWRKEIDWLLSVTEHIVEFVPSQQKSKDGINMEIMVTRQRTDLLMNIPALRKLDAMLIGYLENFKYQNEFWYVSKNASEEEKGNEGRTTNGGYPLPRMEERASGTPSTKALRLNSLIPKAISFNYGLIDRAQSPRSQEQDRSIQCNLEEEDDSQGWEIYLGFCSELREERAV
ncbi:hypothetical protein IFM89_029763 [Coptis chinensis]|uniref:PRONE domain-containing protein n=1 Tax=Coptis chinensis TaxID=261450 RepID=A0A835MAA9_9MAGN|nr:hypothetical protein IFM89_029763 [Coptis chinensis]